MPSIIILPACIEDRAIVGTALSRYNKPANMENAKLLDMEFMELMKNLFGVKATLVDSHYQGQLLNGALYYVLDKSADQRWIHEAR